MLIVVFFVSAVSLVVWWAERDPWGTVSNILDALVVGTLTAVVIDGILVGGRSRRLETLLARAEDATRESFEKVGREVDGLVAHVVDGRPEPPLWLNPCYFSEMGVRDDLEHGLRGARESLVDLASFAGVPLSTERLQHPVEDGLTQLAAAYGRVSDAFDAIGAASHARGSLLAPGTDDERQVALAVAIRRANVAVSGLTEAGRRMSSALNELWETATSLADTLDPVAFQAHRRVPRWIRIPSYGVAVGCFGVLLWSLSSRWWTGPPTFWRDNWTNLFADLAVALIAAVLALAARHRRRAEIFARTIGWYTNVILPVSQYTVSFTQADDVVAATQALESQADLLEEALVSIQIQNSSAELAYWSQVTLRRMRSIAAGPPPVVSAEQSVDDFFARMKRPGHPDLIAQNQELRERHVVDRKEFQDRFGLAPAPAFFDLHRSMEQLVSAAKSACCVVDGEWRLTG